MNNEHLIEVYTVKVTQSLRLLAIPLIVIFPRAASEPDAIRAAPFPIKMLDTKGVDDSEEDPTVAYQTLVPEFEDSLYYSGSGETAEDLPSKKKKIGLVADFNYKLFESSLQHLWSLGWCFGHRCGEGNCLKNTVNKVAAVYTSETQKNLVLRALTLTSFT